MRSQARWWVGRKIQNAPKVDAESPEMADGAGLLDDCVSDIGFLFKNNTPPKDWKEAIYGGVIPFRSLGPLPSHGSSFIAVTRLLAPADCEAIVNAWPSFPSIGDVVRYNVRVWLNDKLVYDAKTYRNKAFHIHKGANTMQVEWKSEENKPAVPGDVYLPFNDSKSGALLNDLLFDMSGGGK
jgi:hypothetical protein